jgi:ferredoxin
VRICPSNALTLPGTTLQLAFTEERCLQCGLCANVCPEHAITMVPRLLTSKAARLTPRVVAEAEPFSCHGCGKQFATKAMIERSRAMMANHPMFQGEQARLMALCPDCRQRAMAGIPG